MTREEEFELALAQRGAQFREQLEAERFERLVDLFDTKGAAWINEHLGQVLKMFTPKFFGQHVRFEHYGTPCQRVRLRCDIREEARQ